ncbi:unnamed protein product (macronuclear) [Paramecium tetraurelia]|uniref:Uncharacterized protein n=1 Tax=Paramecium tetraurelia TaxID=5888 RepID=A0DHG6_PARTE|nr:uncharacterized protein GSPATT00016870001 [Paramecium tetraurelia]CAK82483.1 unnamed protein product [Paramecium tetraurelia]|eukprot:XP_001449880.1 hypothetical protein (macronuclear) [Paramecium tetraurelia strain d4-2]
MKKIAPSLQDYQSAGQGYLLKYIQTLSEAEQNSIMNKLQKYDIKQLYQVNLCLEIRLINNSRQRQFRWHHMRQSDVQSLMGKTRRLDMQQQQRANVYGNPHYLVAIVMSAQQNISLLDIQLPSHKCLFQLYCERIWSLQNLIKQRCGKCLPILIFIMTTNINHEMITSFFQEKNHFGLQDDQIFFIQQDKLPLFSMEGQILFSNESQIFDEYIGNGNIYLNQSVLDTMKFLGITILHLCSIENVLCKFGDPLWIGAFIRNQLYLSAKCVQKRSVDENLGIVCNTKVYLTVIPYLEYDEISYSDLVKRDKNGSLANPDGVIGQVLCSLDYALELLEIYNQTSFHIRQKKCTYFDYITSRLIKPMSQSNALKFELTYYQAIPYCPIQSFGLFRVKREDEYAPILNPSNETKDTIHTARQAYMRRDQKWMSRLGFEVNQEFEISPKLTYFGEGLEEATKKQIKNKLQIPLILHSEKQIRTVRVNSVHNQQPQSSPCKYSSQVTSTQNFQQSKMSIHQSLNHLKQPITSSLVTPTGNQSFQLSGRKSIDQKPSRQTDYYHRPNLNQLNKPLFYAPNTYYLPKK